MAGITLPNARMMNGLNLRSKSINVENKLILGGDYIFIIDSMFVTDVGNILPINIDGHPLRSNSPLMDYEFHESPNTGLYAIILHIANLVDCTIVHARVTSDKYDLKRQANERKYASEIGLHELSFPYKSQKNALDMMRDKNKYYVQTVVANTITRRQIDNLIWDDEVFDPFNTKKEQKVYDPVISIHNTIANSFNRSKDENEICTEANNVPISGSESFDDFVKNIKKSDNNPTDSNTAFNRIQQITDNFINDLSEIFNTVDFNEDDKSSLEAWVEDMQNRLENKLSGPLEKIFSQEENAETPVDMEIMNSSDSDNESKESNNDDIENATLISDLLSDK